MVDPAHPEVVAEKWTS